MATAILTVERLRELLHYEPSSGIFTWRLARQKCSVGTVAGSKTYQGYVVIRVEDRLYRAHRLALFYAYGAWPTADTDHMNGQRDDNRLANLREATRGENMQNLRTGRSASGMLGVHWQPNRAKPWCAQIMTNGKRKTIGYFSTPELAHAAYLEAKRRLHPFSTI